MAPKDHEQKGQTVLIILFLYEHYRNYIIRKDNGVL